MKICLVITARPSYSRVRALLMALRARPDVELQLVVCASALLERYGKVVDVIREDGFEPAAEVYSVYEGETLETSAKSTATLLGELASVLRRLQPALVVCHADRHEVLAAAQAASYQHCPLAHLQGGETTGSIDDRVRDAITQLADYHLVSTARAVTRVLTMRGAQADVFWTGCPSIDLCVGLEDDAPVTVDELGGAGAPINLAEPFICLLQHPTSEAWSQAHGETIASLAGCCGLGLGVLAFWPGNEAGMDGASKALREHQGWLHTVRNLPPRRFLKLLTRASVLVGNSSVGIRECSYLGVPVVNVGQRQRGRERGPNVVDVPRFEAQAIAQAIRQQVVHGKYPSSGLYGDGDAGQRMAEVLVNVCVGADTRAVGQ